MSGHAHLGWTNYFVSGALRAGSEVTARPFTNLSNTQGGSLWQTAGATTAADGAWGEIDAGRPVTWRDLGLFRTNLTTSASIRWMLGTAAGAANVHDTGMVAANVAIGYGQTVTCLPADKVARYLRFEINDPANPDGNIQAALGFGGPVWVPPRNFSFDHELRREDGNGRTVTKSGSEYISIGWQRRVRRLDFKGIGRDDVYDQVMELDRVARLDTNVLIVPFPGSGRECREAIFGLLQGGPVTEPSYNRSNWSFELSERL